MALGARGIAMGQRVFILALCLVAALAGQQVLAELHQAPDNSGYGVALAQQQSAPALRMSGEPAPGIRQVDFRHFTYPMLTEDRKDYGLPERVTVLGGKATFGQGGEEVFFEVESVYYARFTGGRAEEVLVEASCGYTSANAWSDDFYLFAEADGQVRCLTAFGSHKLYMDYVHYYPGGILWELKAVRVQNGTISLDYLADGCHAQPGYISTLVYRWNGSTFELIGPPQRRPFKG